MSRSSLVIGGCSCQVNVLAYDYSGYGWSDGEATEAALYKDIQAVYKYAVTELKVAPHNIILVSSAPQKQARPSRPPLPYDFLSLSVLRSHWLLNEW